MVPCPFPKLHPSALRLDDEHFMMLAYNEAIAAWNEDEVPIGAVVVGPEGMVIARAHNQVECLGDPTAHAEILAITQAASALQNWRLAGCTLYVTKEPCPMCSGAVIMSRVDRVVYAVPDPKMGGLGGAFDVNAVPTLNHHLRAEPGPLGHECLTMLQAFFKLKRDNGDAKPALEVLPDPTDG